MTYRLRSEAASDVFDNEVVVVNLTSGNYYSIQGAGLLIWPLLKDGLDLDGLLEEFRTRYPDHPDLIEQTKAFFSQLEDEKLVEQSDESPGAESVEWPSKLGEPVIEVYKDLQDLLLLDPIHGVDPDQGWPKEKTSSDEEVPSKS